ncbi:hypothetical protein DP279_23180 [Shigella boydii]|nr:hypothetical protein [Shigella boydii]
MYSLRTCFIKDSSSYVDPQKYRSRSALCLKWSTKTGHRVRVFPVSIFRFVWGNPPPASIRSSDS